MANGRHPLLVLSCFTLPFGGGGAVVGWIVDGWSGVGTAVTAWLVCWSAGLAAWWAARGYQASEQISARVLRGMLPRLAIPLGSCMVVYLAGGMLVDCGFVYYILVFYFVTLAVETGLLVRQ